MFELSQDEWREIYLALDSRLHSHAAAGTDVMLIEWRASLRRLLERIGPEGLNAFHAQQTVAEFLKIVEQNYLDTDELAERASEL